MSNIYNTYNARYIEPKQVAERFIYSESFEKLIQNNHTVILGARGCGKTTLMKMLTLPALYSWKDSSGRAERIRNEIEFYSVYISTDIYWDVKNQTYEKQLTRYGNFADKISRFTVNSNIFISLCDTFLNILDFEISERNIDQETELCKCLIDNWKLNGTLPRLEYIKESLLKRIDFVNQVVQDVIFNYAPNEGAPNFDFFNLKFDTSLNYVISAFKRIYKLDSSKNWALCFDELEFAPEWLQTELYQSLRSRDQKFLYKISSSPILPKEIEKYLTSEYSASPGNDLDLIKMWSLPSNEDFSRKLIESLLYHKVHSDNASNFFGSNPLYIEGKESYNNQSHYIAQIKELVDKDQSFKQFLTNKGIDVQNPLPKTEDQKDSVFRKMKPIVYFRNYFMTKDSKEVGVKLKPKKKATDLYNGIELLSKICEGNPRWIIVLTNSILLKSDSNTAKENIQYDEIIKISNRFINSIENIPVKLQNPELTMSGFTDKIGSYFKNQIFGQKFIIEPSSTFTYDAKNISSQDYKTLIEKGLFQGAFILVENNNQNENFDFKIDNKRIKLSYMYYPSYRLPIRKSEPTNLSSILSSKRDDITLFDQEL